MSIEVIALQVWDVRDTAVIFLVGYCLIAYMHSRGSSVPYYYYLLEVDYLHTIEMLIAEVMLWLIRV